MLAVGLCLVGIAIILPAADANRRAADARDRLLAEQAALQTQAEAGDDLLRRIASDRRVAERLARRLRPLPTGVASLETTHRSGGFGMSPYALLQVEVEPAPPPRPAGGGLMGRVCRDHRGRLAVVGVGFAFCLLGLFAGDATRSTVAAR